MEIRGHQYAAVQASVNHDSGATPTDIIAGVTGKTLYLNYILVTHSDFATLDNVKLTDGSGGTAFYFQETNSGQERAVSIVFGEYGYALTEGNGLWAETEDTGTDITVTALGYFK
jgi:hypothetical protein